MATDSTLQDGDHVGWVAKSMKTTARRFPIALAGVLGLAGWSLWIGIFDPASGLMNLPFLLDFLLVILCLVSWDISTRLLSEERKLSNDVHWTLKLGGTVATMAVLWNIPAIGEKLFLGLGLVLLVVIAGGSRRLDSDQWLWDANVALFLRIGSILLLAAPVFVSIMLIEKGILDVFFSSKSRSMHAGLGAFLISLFVFIPISSLFSFPSAGRLPFSGQEVRVVTFLTATIFVPLCVGYLVLIYIQAVFFLFRGEIPANATRWLFSIYGVFGIVTWMLAAGCRTVGCWRHVEFYVRYFFPALVIPVVVLVYALHLRVAAYGWTPGRVALAGITLWFVASIAWWLVRRHTGLGMRAIPVILLAICAMSACGPLSLTAVTERSQIARTASVVRNDVPVRPPTEPARTPRRWQLSPYHTAYFKSYHQGLDLPPGAIWIGSVYLLARDDGFPQAEISPGAGQFDRIKFSFETTGWKTMLRVDIGPKGESQSISLEKLMGGTIVQIKKSGSGESISPQILNWPPGDIWIYPQRIKLVHDEVNKIYVESATFAVVLTAPSK